MTSDLRPLTSALWRRYLPLALFSVLWLDLIRQLSYTWETNEQYAYGWFVPIFALALLWRRWPDRPGSEIRDQKSEVSPSSDLPSPKPFDPQPSTLNPQPPSPSSDLCPPTSVLCPLSSVILLLALALLPLRLIHEINQDWPLFSWPLTLAVVSLTLYAVFLMGGWPWVKHFAFPICFILVAVQWPYRIENPLTKGLMRVVASLTVEVLGWLDVPALQRGNIIEIATGTVGVDEACSGIRSFQSTLMAGLLMGELYRLRVWARAGLVGFGLLLAFGFNVIRTLILTWQANAHGLSAIDKWHDPAGMTITIACFFCLWAIAVLLTKRFSAAPQPSTLNPHPPSPSSVLRHPTSGSPPSGSSPTSDLRPLTPVFRFLLAIGLWSLLCIGATEAWYCSHELRRSESVHWWVNYPTNLPSFREVPVSKFARKLLKYDQASVGSWTEPDGTQWSVYCFRWRAGDPTARMSALGHRPEYCMTGSGHELKADLGVRYFPANGLDLPFRTYIFDAPARPLHVFFCLWEDGTEKQTGFGKSKYGDRLLAVLAGRRGLGQQTLEIICRGYQGIEQAQAAVTARLPELIRTGR